MGCMRRDTKGGGRTKGGNGSILFIEKYNNIILRITDCVIGIPFIV